MLGSSAVALALLASSSSIPSAAAAREIQPPSGFDFGPRPDWAQSKQLIEDAVRSGLIDPDSAQFEWPFGFKQGSWQVMFGSRYWGWVVCGIVNAKNRFGGYVGRSNFVAVMRNGEIVYRELADGPGGFVSGQCARVNLPPAPSEKVASLGYGYGFFSKQIPDGLFIVSVIPGSPAAIAGVKAGMVLTGVNGISLRGLSEDVTGGIVSGSEGVATFTFAGGAVIKMQKAKLPSSDDGSPDDLDRDEGAPLPKGP